MQATQPETSRRRVSLYDQRVEDAAQAVRGAIDAIVAMSDPEARARAATAVLAAFTQGNEVLARARREDIIAMRSTGMTYTQIGAVIGTSRSRAKQIESGMPMGNSARGRAEKASPD